MTAYWALFQVQSHKNKTKREVILNNCRVIFSTVKISWELYSLLFKGNEK
jgi:hypothetical protein